MVLSVVDTLCAGCGSYSYLCDSGLIRSLFCTLLCFFIFGVGILVRARADSERNPDIDRMVERAIQAGGMRGILAGGRARILLRGSTPFEAVFPGSKKRPREDSEAEETPVSKTKKKEAETKKKEKASSIKEKQKKCETMIKSEINENGARARGILW